MGAVALFVIWAGYATGMWGYCLIRGYCVTPMDILSPSFPAKMAASKGGAGSSSGSQAGTTPPVPNQAQTPIGKGVTAPVQPNPSDPLNPSGTPTGNPVISV